LKRAKIAKKFAKLRFGWPKKPKFGIHVPHLKLPKGNLPSLRIPIPGRSIRKPKIKLPGRLHCGRNSASSSMVCVTSEAIEKLSPLGEAGALSRQARLCRVSPPVPPRDKYSLSYECGPPNPPPIPKPKVPATAPAPEPPPNPDRNPGHIVSSLMPAPLRPSKKPTLGDQHDLIDEEAYADFFNDVYFADIVDGLSCGADANGPADYREHSVGGGCYYVPHPQKDTSQAPNEAIDSAVGAAQPIITPAPATNSIKGSRWGNSTIDPYAIPPQDENFLTDELVPPSGLAPTYYAEVEDGTAWL
jgi:hypothetical protein